MTTPGPATGSSPPSGAASTPGAADPARAPASTSTAMGWWGRLLLVLVAEAMLFLGYAWQARPAVFEQLSPPWIVYVFCAFLLVVIIQGSSRFPTWVHGAIWLAGMTAAVAGVWGAVPAYVSTVGQERTVTVVAAERDSSHVSSRSSTGTRHSSTSVFSIAEVRGVGETTTREAYLRGDWETRLGQTTTVREDPLGIAGLQEATPMSGLRIFWFVLWIPAFVILQLGLLAVVFRRGPSMLSSVPDGRPA